MDSIITTLPPNEISGLPASPHTISWTGESSKGKLSQTLRPLCSLTAQYVIMAHGYMKLDYLQVMQCTTYIWGATCLTSCCFPVSCHSHSTVCMDTNRARPRGIFCWNILIRSLTTSLRAVLFVSSWHNVKSSCFLQCSIWHKWLRYTCNTCWIVYMKNKIWTTVKVSGCSLMSSANDTTTFIII